MASKDFVAVPYMAAVHRFAVPGQEPRERRFRIISKKTGRVLDNARGYGYKSAQKAYIGYFYKRQRSCGGAGTGAFSRPVPKGTCIITKRTRMGETQ